MVNINNNNNNTNNANDSNNPERNDNQERNNNSSINHSDSNNSPNANNIIRSELMVFCENCDERIPNNVIPRYWTPIFCLYCRSCARLRV